MSTVKRRSQKQEKSVAKDFNARPTVASGALWGMKGDVRNDKFLIECKTTEKDYYSITTKVWEKIEDEALKDRMRTPLLIIDLQDTDRYVVFNPNQFIRQVNTCQVAPHVHGGCKSYRFKGYTQEDLPILFSVIPLKSKKKNHILMVMKMTEFEDFFEKELKEE